MTSPPAWTRETLKRFTDAATDAVAKTIVDFQRESGRERELQKAQFAARMSELGYRLESIADLERRLSERLATLKDGRDGTDGTALTIDDVRPAIAQYVDHVLAGWERPRDGKSVTVEEVEPVLRDLVSEAVAGLRQDQARAAHHWPPRAGWPHNLPPILDVDATPYLADDITAAVKLLGAPA